MFSRRESLLGSASAFLAANALPIASAANAQARGKSALELASDELFWLSIAKAYQIDGRWVILNGGGNNPHPTSVVNAFRRYDELASSAPRPHNYTLWARIDDHRERLAALMGCSPDELAITRNTTEGLNIVGWGLPLERGDEVLISNAEDAYARKILDQRARRHGIVVKRVELPLEPTAQQAVDLFASAITPRTKLLVASHVVDGLGYVLPIKELARLAHKNGAQLLVDGALGFGLTPVNVKEMECDYYATSLHKWLNAPLGTGALYVRRDRLENLWPLYGTRRDADDISKFEDIGTRSGPTIAAIGEAISFYEQIGPERKAERARYLTSLVREGLQDAQGVRVISERDPAKRTGLARVAIEGFSGLELTRILREEFGFYTYGNWPGRYDGVYISPNVFNTAQQMQGFVRAIRMIAGRTRVDAG